MTIIINAKTAKDRLKDETLDFSLCDLQEVPVREIALVKKATHLDLSNNLLVTLPKNFVILRNIVKLDLSKNMLTEIPENFGEMKQLKYLDLYANQISRLPLSLSELKNLRWLDLKENPLTPAVASVAGPCSNMSECQACARNIVAYLSNVKLTINEEKLRRLNTVSDNKPVILDKDVTSVKQGKKKKKVDKGNKKTFVVSDTPPVQEMDLQGQNNRVERTDEHDIKKTESLHNTKGGAFYKILTRILLWFVISVFLCGLAILLLPAYDKEYADIFNEYVRKHTGLSLKTYQTTSTELFYEFLRKTKTYLDLIHSKVTDSYFKYIKVNFVKGEL